MRLALPTRERLTVLKDSVELPAILRTSGRCILTNEAWDVIAKSLQISSRELQIIQEVFDDRKEFAIAHDLNISVHTVHTHLERIYRKLGVSSRLQLVIRIFSEYLSLFR